MMYVYNRIPRSNALLGVVRAEGLQADAAPPGFETALSGLLRHRKEALSEGDEAVRLAARDLLRNGRYKPTGRGKPASEYLLRAAHEAFPRINAPVDVCNYVSLRTLLPISLWDLDRAGTDHYVFRLGRSGEAYAFNAAGQDIDLEDLVVGCRAGGAGDLDGTPIVNPVKDCMATKTNEASERVGACVYTPGDAVDPDRLARICELFADLLAACGPTARTAYALVSPGEAVELHLEA